MEFGFWIYSTVVVFAALVWGARNNKWFLIILALLMFGSFVMMSYSFQIHLLIIGQEEGPKISAPNIMSGIAGLVGFLGLSSAAFGRALNLQVDEDKLKNSK